MGKGSPSAALILATVVSACTSAAPPASPTPEVSAPSGSSGAVAPPSERTFFVSTAGDDAAPGTESRPVRTLQAAQTAVRAALAKAARQNVRVQVAAGTYALASTLTFDERDSPADGFTVRFTGPADASAVITTDRAIDGWERATGEIQRAKLPQGLTFSTLFENDRPATLARAPNEGYLRVDPASGPIGSQTQLIYRAGDLPEGIDPVTATVYVWPGCEQNGTVNRDWEADVVPVKTIEPGTRTITLAIGATYPICANNRYFVQGSRSLLDRPGEFALDQGYVYYWPRSSPISSQRIVAPALARLIEVKGTSVTTLAKNVSFERLTFARSDAARTAQAGNPGGNNAAVHIENAENVTVRASRIVDVGGDGIQLRGHAQRVVVDGNLIEGVGVHGVEIRGPGPDQPRDSKENRITNNRIRAGGRLHGSGSGVKIANSAANEVSNNEISDMPRYGISLKGLNLTQLQQSYPKLGATQQNINDLRHARENVIRRNDISRVVTDSQDAGGIEMWGAGPANRVEENRVHDIDTGGRNEGYTSPNGRGPLLYGIYIDDGSDGVVVRSNVVFGIRGPNAAPVTVKGIGGEVSRNVLICDGASAGIETSVVAGIPVEALRWTQNIIVRSTGSDIYWMKTFSDKTLAEADRNLFFNAGGSYSVRFRFANEVLSLDQWRARYGFDKASVTADPLFVDAAKGDYRVREGSPAHTLGFVNVDPSVVGLRPEFAFKR